MIPGEYRLASGDINCNAGRQTEKVVVVNRGDRPVQVGSHFHFFEVNRQMQFDRPRSLGMRLNIAAGTAVRFEPGEEKEVELVSFGGTKTIVGFSNLLNGCTTLASVRESALARANEQNFQSEKA